MKRFIALCLVLVLSLSMVACSKKGIPTLSAVKAYLPKDFTANMADVTRDELIEAWGEPGSSNAEYNYDSWKIDDESAVTIDWDENGKFEEGVISMS